MTTDAAGNAVPGPSPWPTSPSDPSTRSWPLPMSSSELLDPRYDDPEADEDWILPSRPLEENLEDNTSCWGPLYAWRGPINPRQHPLAIALTREITPPWRRGMGITWRTSASHGRAVGLWFKGRPPAILSQPPAEQDATKVIQRANRLGTLPAHE